VWMVDLGMAAKVRPCVVVSAPIGDADRAVITIVPHTTSTRQTPFEAAVTMPYLKPGAFDAQGIVSVPVTRAFRYLGKMTASQMQTVEEALCRWLRLPHS